MLRYNKLVSISLALLLLVSTLVFASNPMDLSEKAYASHVGDLNISWEVAEAASLPPPDIGDCSILDLISTEENIIDDEAKAVMAWLQKYANLIVDAERIWDVDRRAIAAAIAWEALRNPQHYDSPMSDGVGKIHAFNRKEPYYSIADEIEADENAFNGASLKGKKRYLPPVGHETLKDITAQPEGAIKYIAAIMRAISDAFSTAGYDISRTPEILTFYYHGRYLYFDKKDSPSAYTRASQLNSMTTKPSLVDLSNRVGNDEGKHMGFWTKNHLKYLQVAVGFPDTFTDEGYKCLRPTADAGPDQEVVEYEGVSLDGSGSRDPDGIDNLSLKYKWDQVSGPGVNLRNADSSQPFFTAPAVSGNEPVFLIFKLSVSDREQDSLLSDFVTIRVNQINGLSLTVNTNDRSDDAEGCTIDHCTLSEAIKAANENQGKDKIKFNLPTNQFTILTGGSLDVTDPVIIDGSTQFGYAGTPLIEVSDSTPGDYEADEYGLGIFGGNSIVKGLIINGFTTGIFLSGNRGDVFTDANGDTVIPIVPAGGNVIEGNYIGTDRNGAAAKGNFFGIDISGSKNNLIGGYINDTKTRNIISGNHIGVRIINGIDKLVVSGGSSTVTTHFCNVNCASAQNSIAGNYIGVDNTGQNPLPNGYSGVYIADANNNLIGGNRDNERNIISGNGGDGIFIAGLKGPNSFKNKVQGNYIGTDISGGVKLVNKGNGIKIAPFYEEAIISPFQNVIGGIAAGEGNTISGNEKNGVHIEREAKSNWIQGNRIGTDNEGKLALGNLQNGVSVVGASTTLVGGPDSGARNIISANGENGILIGEGSKTNYVFGNYIGKDISAGIELGNGKDGVALLGSSNNSIGTTHPSELNIISANGGNGVSVVQGSSSSISNSIRGNSIYDNGKLGIDLGNNGITQNDDDDNDADSGPNDLVNYPTEGFIYYDSEEDLTIFTGILNTPNPSSTAIDIYANAHTDSLGFGEGRKYVGQIPFFNSNKFYGALPGDVTNVENGLYANYPHFTATTTDIKESTSEFSKEFVRITPPLADAGQQQIVRENANVTLDGSNSTAVQGASITSYLWRQIESQPQVSLSSSASPRPHFKAPEISAEQGYATLFFRLTVTDSNGIADNDTVAVIVMDKNAYFDDDGDGIEDQIDTRPDIFSGNFSDIVISGTTNGTIIDRNNHTLLVLEEPNPDGVRIIDVPPAGLIQNRLSDISNTIRSSGAEIEACGGSIRTFIDHGEEFVLTCGSAIFQAFEGIISIELRANDGTLADIGVTAGNKIKFNPETTLLEADAKNSLTLVVFVTRGNQTEVISLAPGESKFLSSNPGLFASAGPDRNVVEGTVGNVLDGSGSLGSNSTITSYQWRQITTGGVGATNEPVVSIRNSNNGIARFDAPLVTEDTPLTFELTIANNDTDTGTITSSDRVVITIRNSVEPGQGQQQQQLPYRFLTKWGTSGSGDGQLSSPSGVAFDASSGDVYVADTGNHRIQKFSRDGTFIAKWGTSGSADGQFSSPQGLALDPQGNLYVADTGNHRIQKFSRDGTFIAKWGTLGTGDGQFSSPRGVSVDTSGNIVYVADTGNNRIQKFTNSGSFIMKWGSQCDLTSIDQVNATAFYAGDLQTSCIDPDGQEGGTYMPGDGQFSSPSSISIDPLTSNVIVSDTDNHRLQSFSADGQLIQKIGTKLFIHQTVFFGKTLKLIAINANTYGNIVNQPFGLAFDGVGDLYSVSKGNIGSLPYRILKFDDSLLQRAIGYIDPFDHPHGFNAPTGISVESTGNIFFVADTGNNRIQVFARIDNEAPSVQDTPTILINRNTPVDITLNATDPDIVGNANNNTGLTFSIDQYPVNGTIVNFNPNTHTLTYKPRTNFGGDDMFTFKVSDGVDSTIGEIRIHVNRPPISDAGPDKTVVEGAKGITLQGFNSQDEDIGYGDSIVSTFWRQILTDANTPKVNLTGNTTNTATFDAPQVNADTILTFELADTDTLGLTSTDTVTVTVRNIDNTTEHYSFLTKWGSKGIFGGQFDSPADVAYDSENNIVYVSDQFNDRIQMFDTAGTSIGGFGTFGTVFSGPGSFFEPKGIAFSPLEGTTNKVYVADSRNHRVQVFSPQGSGGDMWGSFGSGNGQFNNPSAVAVDPITGNVYVGESGNPRVQKFTPTGQFILKFGSSGGADGQFRFGVSDIVVDSAGNVYVVDLFNRIQKFSSTGQFISKLNGITGTNIGIDSADNLYIVDKSGNILRKVNPATNTVLSQIGSYNVRGNADGQFFSPQGIAADPSGNIVFIADTGNNRIQAFSKYPNNPPVASDNQRAATDINTSFDIQLDTKDPDIGDKLTFSLLKDSKNGSVFLHQNSGIASYSPSFNFTGTDNFTYSVTDGFAKDNGTVTVEVGLRPVAIAGPDQTVNETTAVVLDGSASYNPPDHSIVSYVWEQQIAPGAPTSSRVELLQTDHSSPVAQFNSPRVDITSELPLTFKLTVTDDRGLTSTDTVIIKVRNDNADRYSFLTKWGTAGPDIGQFNWPEGIAQDKSNGDIYVADTENNRIQKFNENGTFIKTWGFRNTASINVDGAFRSVYDVAVDSERGYIYATDGSQTVQVFNRDGVFGKRFGQFGGIAGVEVDSSGNVYVADSSDNKVFKYSSFGGTLLKEFGSGTGFSDGRFSGIYDLAVDSKGNVYITDYQGGISPIQKFDSNGKFVSKWESDWGSEDGQFGDGRARGITIDSHDHLYVVDTENNRIQKFDSSGNFITKFGLTAECHYDFEIDEYVCPPYTSTDDGVFDFPTRIAVEPTGDFVFIADLSNNRIQKFARVNATEDNSFPVVTDKLVSTLRSTPITITLNATDSDLLGNNNNNNNNNNGNENESLTFSISRNPAHGTLSQIVPMGSSQANVTYTPRPNYYGNDTFSYQVTDRRGAIDIAIVTIMIGDIPTPPVALNQTITTTEDRTTEIILNGQDFNNDTLAFYILPVNEGEIKQWTYKDGEIAGRSSYDDASGKRIYAPPQAASIPSITRINDTAAKILYVPPPNFNGTDSFQFFVRENTVLDYQSEVAGNITVQVSPKPANLAFSDGDLFISSSETIERCREIGTFFICNDGLQFYHTSVNIAPQVQWRSANGTQQDLLFTPEIVADFNSGTRLHSYANRYGGTAFDPSQNNLYLTEKDPNVNKVLRTNIFDNSGRYAGVFADDRNYTYDNSTTNTGVNATGKITQGPTSVVFDHAGNAYVAYRDSRSGTSDNAGSDSENNVNYFFVNKFNPDGVLVDAFELPYPKSDTRYFGSFIHDYFWIDLASDQRTLYYTTASGESIKRYDTLRKAPLPDFASCLTGVYPSDIHILPDGGVIVIDSARLATGGFIAGVHTSTIAEPSRILRIDKTGAITQVYDAPGRDTWTSISLDPDKKSFWAADDRTSNIVKFDIASGNALKSFDSGLERHSIAGLGIRGEPTAALTSTNGTFIINNTNTAAIGGPCQSAPIVQDITAATTNNTSVNITLTGTDANRYEYLTFSILNNTQNGTLGSITQINNTAANITYIPNAEVRNGTDSFTYRANDGILNSDNIATVSILVSTGNGTIITPPPPIDNLSPIANAGPDQTVNENTTVTLNGTASYDPDGNDGNGIIGEINNNNITSYLWKQITSALGSGNNNNDSITLSNATSVTPVFTSPSVAGNNISANLSFNLTVTDSDNATNSDIVNITVNNVNQLPLPENQNVTVDEDTAVIINLTGNDPDLGDTLSFSVLQQPLFGNLTIDNNNNGISVSSNGSFVYTPNTNYYGTDSFTFSVSDNVTSDILDQSNGTVNITINPINDAPVAINDTLTTNEDASVSIDVLGNDYDVDINDTISPYLSQAPLQGGNATINTNNNTITYSPPSDFFGTDLFAYLVKDNNNATSAAPASVIVNVSSVNDAPLANSGTDFELDENTTGVLNGTASFDPDTVTAGDTITSYGWVQTQGPTVSLREANTATPSFTAPLVDEDTLLRFNLTVTDNNGLASVNPSSVSVTVRNINQPLPLPPIASIIPTNQTVDEDTTGVTLSGLSSYDPDGGTIISYSWNQISGPQITLNSSSSPIVQFDTPSIDTNTTLVFDLVVTDDEGTISTNDNNNTAAVLVRNTDVNQPSIANAGPDQTVDENTTNVILDGSGSYDPDGIPIASYNWQQIEGPAINLSSIDTAITSFTAPLVTEDTLLRFNLTVVEFDGDQSASDTVDVMVKNVNQPPIANAGPDQTVDENTANVILDGSASTDPDGGSIELYNWEQTQGPPVTLSGADTAAPTFTAPTSTADITLTFSLTVTDNQGLRSTAADTVSIIVKNVDQPPIASATVFPSTTVNKDTLVTLDGSASTDPDNNIATYKWEQTSGSPSIALSGANTAQAAFTAPSVTADTTFAFKLTVTDSEQASATTSVNVIVLKDTTQPPTPTLQPRGMGFWKTHQQETTALLPIMLDTNYNIDTWAKASNIFNKATAKNAYDMLAGQLLSAKLNIKNGVATCSIINDAIIQADSILTNAAYKGPGTTKAPTGSMKNTVTDLTSKLDNYNNYGCSAFDSTPPAIVGTTP